MARKNFYYDALSSAEQVLQRMRCINQALLQVDLKTDPLSPEFRSVAATALMEHQIRCEEVIPFPVGYDPRQYTFGIHMAVKTKTK